MEGWEGRIEPSSFLFLIFTEILFFLHTFVKFPLHCVQVVPTVSRAAFPHLKISPSPSVSPRSSGGNAPPNLWHQTSIAREAGMHKGLHVYNYGTAPLQVLLTLQRAQMGF